MFCVGTWDSDAGLFIRLFHHPACLMAGEWFKEGNALAALSCIAYLGWRVFMHGLSCLYICLGTWPTTPFSVAYAQPGLGGSNK